MQSIKRNNFFDLAEENWDNSLNGLTTNRTDSSNLVSAVFAHNNMTTGYDADLQVFLHAETALVMNLAVFLVSLFPIFLSFCKKKINNIRHMLR
jgi:Na+-transporting NADH:ubiquinone oxidoreductase subunit NqrD